MADDRGLPRNRSWRSAPAEAAGKSPSAQRIKRFFFTALGLVLMVLFAVWLIRPLFNPNVHFLCLPVTEYRFLCAPPIAFSQEDIEGFAPLRTSLHGGEPPIELRNSQTSSGMDKLAAELGGHVARAKDVLLFYVSAHGVSEDGTAYLLSSGYDPTRGDEGRYKVADFLKQIATCRAQLKLLILDAGRIDSDPRLGMLVNEFPRLLEQEVRQINDPTLWVLNSNSALETSWTYYPAKRSVFGYFVAEGLKGAADQAGKADNKIDLKEFAEYVQSNVAAWVQEASGGNASQTPMLVHADAQAKPTEQLVLLPVPRQIDEPAAEDPPKKEEPAAEPKKDDASKTTAENDPTTNRRIHAFLASVQAPPPKQEKADPPATPETSQTKDAAKPADSPAPKQEKTQDTSKATDATKSQADPAKQPPAGSSLATPTGSGRQIMLQTLQQAWELSDRLRRVDGNSPAPRIIDYAPHLWREFQETLLEYERRYLAGNSFALSKEADNLAQYIRSIASRTGLSAATSEGSTDERLQLSERIERADPRVTFPAPPQHSVSFARLVAPANSGEQRRFELLMSKLDKIATMKPGDLSAWANDPDARQSKSAWAKGAAVPVELATAFRLEQAISSAAAQDAETLWPAVQLAISTRRLAEHVASYAPWCQPWIGDRVERGDRHLVEAERLLARGFAPAAKDADQKLKEAQREYLLAKQDAELVRQAIELKNDLIFAAPYYARCPSLINDDDVRSLIRRVVDLAATLEKPAAGLRRVADQKQLLEKQRDELERSIRSAWSAITSGNIAELADARRIEELLNIPLLDAASRVKLLSAITTAPSKPVEWNAEKGVDSPRTSSSDWKRVVRRAELELQLLKLATLDSSSVKETTDLAEAAKQLGALLSELKKTLDGTQSAPLSAEAETAVWEQWRQFSSQLKQFYATMPKVVGQSQESTRGAGAAWRLPDQADSQLDAWRAAERILRMIDARDVRVIEEPRADRPNAIARIHRHDLYGLIAWQRQRFVQASQEEVSPEQRKYLQQLAQSCRESAESIGPALAAATAGEGLRLGSVEQISAEQDSATSLVLELSIPRTEQTSGPIEAMVTLEFDPRLVDIRRGGGGSLPGTSDSGRHDVPVVLRPGTPTPLVLDIRARADSNQPTLLVAAARAGNGFDARQVSIELPKPVPVVLFVHPAITGTAIERGKKGIVLQPFPAGTTAYTFYVQNRSGQPKENVQVQLWRVLAAPPGRAAWDELPLDPAGNLSAAIPVEPIPLMEATLSLPDDKALPLKFAPAKAEKPADGPLLEHGLIAAIEVDGKKNYTRIHLEPLHPEKYIKPRVSYDADRGMIDIRVAPLDRDIFRPGGSSIVWDLEPEDLDQGTSRKDQGKILDPDGVATLWAAVERDPDRIVAVRLTIDDYPRAFIYQVPCNDTVTDLPVDTKVRRVRVVDPPAQKKPVAFEAPRDSIAVKLSVDAPQVFPAADALVELTGMPRGIAGSEPQRVRRFSDRQVFLRLEETANTGVMKVHTRVQDFQIELPTVGLSDVRYQIRPRLVEGGRETLGEPVDVYLDATPPVIASLSTSPAGQVEQGAGLRVITDVDDEESDVDSVRVAFTDRADEFDKKMPVDAKRLDPAGSLWVVDLPTDKLQAGVSHRIMVEASNKVGKKRLETAQVTVATKGAATGMASIQVTGKVLLNDKPRADVEVLLIPLGNLATPDKPPRTTKSDRNGSFRFADVAPGEYRVYARGISANARVQGEAKVNPPKSSEAVIHLGF